MLIGQRQRREGQFIGTTGVTRVQGYTIFNTFGIVDYNTCSKEGQSDVQVHNRVAHGAWGNTLG